MFNNAKSIGLNKREQAESPCVLLFLLLFLLTGFTSANAQQILFKDGFEVFTGPQLECKQKGFPCSMGEADPDARDRVLTLLQELWDVRHVGTIDDVHDYLESQTDVVDVIYDYAFVSFRVEGMTPAVFYDSTIAKSAPAGLSLSATQGTSNIQPIKTTDRSADTKSKQFSGNPTTNVVVGEDTTGDGKIDQNDSKNALVLAPFEWDFAPYEESELLASRIELLPGYAGNVVFKRNQNSNLDGNILIEDWLSLGGYDIVAISTHGSRSCWILDDLSNLCQVWISSGVIWDYGDELPFNLIGAWVGSRYDRDAMESRINSWVLLGLDFWRNYYADGLDNQLLSFSACETGNFEGGELAAAIGGENFVMTGWTESVPTDAAFQTALAFYEEMAKGITTREAFDNIDGLGLFPVTHSGNVETSFEVFPSGDDDVRLIELPRLMHEDSEFPEGINISEFVTGTVGDANPDRLTLKIQIDGVTPGSKPEFAVRYKIDDKEAFGSYDLSSASLVSGFEYRYEVSHDIDLGFPLVGGDIPIEVIVDLPEGGTSVYSTNAFLASCSFKATISGDRNDVITGPAQFEIGVDDGLKFTLRNRAAIIGDVFESVSGSFSTGPSEPLTVGEHTVDSAALNYPIPSYNALYIQGDETADCGVCGGMIKLDAITEEQSMAGSAEIIMRRLFPKPEEGQEPTILMEVEFVAAFGSQFDGSSPYVKCSAEYGD